MNQTCQSIFFLFFLLHCLSQIFAAKDLLGNFYSVKSNLFERENSHGVRLILIGTKRKTRCVNMANDLSCSC